MKCLVFKHKWGEWYKGEIGIDFWIDNSKCKRCKKVRGRGGILPPEPWPMPPLIIINEL